MIDHLIATASSIIKKATFDLFKRLDFLAATFLVTFFRAESGVTGWCPGKLLSVRETLHVAVESVFPT